MGFTKRYLSAFELVIINEGVSFVNPPADRGGCSKFGITVATLTAWYATQGLTRVATAQDVAALTLDAARDIYAKLYWEKVQGDVWDAPGLGKALLDCAVLMGPVQAIKYLQRAVNRTDIIADGVIGPKTIAAVKALPAVDVILALSAAMAKHCITLALRDPTQQVFTRTWALRSGRLTVLCLDTAKEVA